MGWAGVSQILQFAGSLDPCLLCGGIFASLHAQATASAERAQEDGSIQACRAGHRRPGGYGGRVLRNRLLWVSKKK